MSAFLLVKKTLIGVDVGDGSPDGVGWIEPTAEVVNIAMAVVVSLLDLNFLVMFDVRNQGDMAISPIVPTGDSADLWSVSCPESSSACTSCPHATVSPPVVGPRG